VEVSMGAKEKSIWVFIIFLLSGIVIGGLLGVLAEKVSWLWWLSYGENFGLKDPISLDLSILNITFGLWIKINVASIVGMVLAIFIYRKVY